MKYLIPGVLASGALGAAAAEIIGRDFAIVGASITGALSYSLVAYSLWPLIKGDRKSILAPGLFGIAICGTVVLAYGPLYIALGRPAWWFAGWPFTLYMAAFAGLIASICIHLISLGHVQKRRTLYIALFAFFLAIGFGTASFLVYTGMIHQDVPDEVPPGPSGLPPDLPKNESPGE